jgi:hypothetical protein
VVSGWWLVVSSEAGAPPASLRWLCRLGSFVDNGLVKKIFEVLNQMQADGVISHYAIGGAVGATFYLEPAATLDVDIFVLLPHIASRLVSLTPIYEYLKARGGIEHREHIILDKWPVQFLVPSDELEREAIAAAIPVNVDGVRTWVMLAEYLVAIALRTGRAKDHIRVLQFIKEKAVDVATLQGILERHGLSSQWATFQKYVQGAL